MLLWCGKMVLYLPNPRHWILITRRANRQGDILAIMKSRGEIKIFNILILSTGRGKYWSTHIKSWTWPTHACYPRDVWGRDKRVIMIALGSAKGLLERYRAGCPYTHMCIYNTETGRKRHTQEREGEKAWPKRGLWVRLGLQCSPVDVLPTRSKPLSTFSPVTPTLGLVLSMMSCAWHFLPSSLCSFLFSLIYYFIFLFCSVLRHSFPVLPRLMGIILPPELPQPGAMSVLPASISTSHL